jgi:hypothetical protein
MMFRENIGVCCENHMKQTKTLCGQNAEFHFVKVGGTHRTVKAFVLLQRLAVTDNALPSSIWYFESFTELHNKA